MSKSSPRGRGRPRGYDSAVVLRQMRECFARQGYAGVTLDSLSNATGLGRPSLYGAYGDKRDMFLRALKAEYDEVCAGLLPQVATDSAHSRIVSFLHVATAGYIAGQAGQTPGITFGAALAESETDPCVRSSIERANAALEAGARRALGPDASQTAVLLLSSLAIAFCVRGRAALWQSVDEVNLHALASFLVSSSN